MFGLLELGSSEVSLAGSWMLYSNIHTALEIDLARRRKISYFVLCFVSLTLPRAVKHLCLGVLVYRFYIVVVLPFVVYFLSVFMASDHVVQ
jgi:hypothetical protein